MKRYTSKWIVIVASAVFVVGFSDTAASSEPRNRPESPASRGSVWQDAGAVFYEAYARRTSASQFLGHNGPSRVLLGRSEVLFSAGGTEALRLKFLGSNPKSAMTGGEPLPGITNYLIGADPKAWRTGIQHYGRVKWSQLYPGIDLIFRGHQGGFEYDWEIGPAGDPERIALQFAEAAKLRLNPSGDLFISSPEGTIIQRAPRAFQRTDGRERSIPVEYALQPGGRVVFRLGRYDRSRPLVIDPVIEFSAMIGGSGLMKPAGGSSFYDEARAVAVDNSGNVYVTGITYSQDFPTVNALQTSKRGFGDAFVVKLNAAGSAVIYATYFGGASTSGELGTAGNGIAVDASGSVYIAGETSGPGLPAVNAIQGNFGGALQDGFVARLDPAGSRLIFSTYLGGSGMDQARALAIDAAGSVYVTGYTGSTNFPVSSGAFQPALHSPTDCGDANRCFDAFLTKLSGTGSLVYSTYFGSSAYDSGNAIAVDQSGSATIAGQTSGGDLVTTPGVVQPAPGSASCVLCEDAFVARFTPSGNALVYSTYLGGDHIDGATAIALDGSGNAYVTGTGGVNFPITPGAFKSVLTAQGAQGAFVSKLNSSGSALVYSAMLAGTTDASHAQARGIAVDTEGNAYVVGYTDTQDFPVVNPVQAGNGGCFPGSPCSDVFVSKLNPSGSALVFSTYLGGTGDDFGFGIARDSGGGIFVVGKWGSGPRLFPQVGPLPRVQAPGEGFVVKISESGTTPIFTRNSETNGASFASGGGNFPSGTAFGGIVTIFGKGLTRVNGIVSASSYPLPTEIAGTSVLINGVPVPLFAVANVNAQEQVNLQVPWEVSGPTDVVVMNNGVRSVPVGSVFFTVQPGIFTLDGSTGAVQHSADFRPVTVADPAEKGEVVVIYATGLGDVQPRPATGQPASSATLSQTIATPTVSIGGMQADVLFSGLTPGFASLYQVNARVPTNAPSGAANLVMSMTAQPGSTVVFTSNVVKISVR